MVWEKHGSAIAIKRVIQLSKMDATLFSNCAMQTTRSI